MKNYLRAKVARFHSRAGAVVRHILSFSVLIAVLPGQSAHPIEIPLEGYGKATSIAYVNMHKIFESFPETEKARVELNRVIEERKADISTKKEEIAKLKGEIDFLRKQMSAVLPSTAPRGAESTNNSAETVLQSSPAAQPNNVTSLTLPDGSPLKFLFSPPLDSTGTPAVVTDTTTPSLQTYIPTTTVVQSSLPQILPGIPSLGPTLQDKEILLAQKEADLETYIGVAEDEVKKMEEGKTMTLMARIYKSLQEIASKEGYSVIVDRETILYGETAVDITQNVIWRLSSPRLK